MYLIKRLLLACGFLLFLPQLAYAKISVVASIKPIHSLVSNVMIGVGKPDLIITGYSSPHTYSMKPSQAKMLQKATLVFWVGPTIEPFLEKPLKTIGAQAVSVPLINSHGLNKLKFRENENFEAHDHSSHEDHGHDAHKEHGHDAHKEHGHDEHKEHGHDAHKEDKHAGHKEHDHDAHDKHDYDPHVWLDPQRAKALVHEIEEALSKVDPENASKYAANAKKLKAKLDKLTTEIKTTIKPVTGLKFIVFHDAYQYFETRFGLSAAGSITVSPEILPGADRVKKLHHKIEELGVRCVFAEPQFEPKIIKALIRGTKARSAVLDPIGAELAPGTDQYFKLINNMASAFKTCL